MKQSKTTIKELQKRYRAVLLKCALINAALLFGIGTANAITISDGTYEDFDHTYFEDLEITGGTFTGEITELTAQNITLSGGTFNSKYLEIEAGKRMMDEYDLTINSDSVNVSGTGIYEFYANRKINIIGEKGLSIINTAMTAPEISGKIIGNLQSFIGNFGNSIDKWNYSAGTLYTAKMNNFWGDVSFDQASLALNGNAVAGTGNYMWNQSARGTNDSDIISSKLEAVQNKLSNAEIENSINLTIAEINRVNANSKDIDDIADAFSNVLDMPASDPENLAIYDIGSLIEEKWWNGGQNADIEQIRTALRDAYTAYNDALDAYSADVTVTDSTITMNNTSALANYTVADDAKGNITVNNSTVTANGTNTISAAKGAVSFENSSTLTVSSGAVLSVISQDSNTVSFDGTSSLNLAGTLNGNIASGTVNINSSTAHLNGALSGTIELHFNDNYVFRNLSASNATLSTIIIADGKTLDIAEGQIAATNITGGTIKLTLPATAVNSAIINASSASDVSLDVDMSKVSRDTAAQYVLTATDSGYTLLNVNNNRYAFSDATFTLDDYKADPTAYAFNTSWHGGTLYILRLATAGEAAVEDLKNSGVYVSANEEKAVAALNDEVIDMLAPAQKATAQRINTLLDAAAGNATQMKQLLREVAPEAAPSASSTASANAGAVMNVVGGRMGGGSPAPAAKGRSGGDYTVGGMTAWAQGLYNSADLHKADGFDADSTGFAAGFEYNINDSVKAGVGYAFTATDIDTARSKTDVDTHTVFAYGEYKPDAFYVNGVLSYGHSKYDETTRLAGLQSDYHANTFAAQAMAGYAINDIVTPEAGLRYTSVRQRSYTNALGARMASKTLDTWTWVAGIKAAKTFREGDTIITPDAKLALTYDFNRDGQNRTVTLANGSSYVADGKNMERFGVELGVGATVKVNNNTDIGLSYEGKFKTHYTDHTGMINVKYNF